MATNSSPEFPYPGGTPGAEAPDPVAGKPGHFAWSRWIKQYVKNLNTNLMAHQDAVDPHPQYLTQTEGNTLYAPFGVTGGGGVTDHGALTGLGNDDHPHYLTEARGNALYAPAGGDTGDNWLDQATADGLYVNATGDTITGDITMAEDVRILGSITIMDELHGGMAVTNAEVYLASFGDISFYSAGTVILSNVNDESALKLTGLAAPTAPADAVNKAYTDARTPPMLVLGPAAPVPGGTPAGTVIVRTAT